jgi:uncharacterized protein
MFRFLYTTDLHGWIKGYHAVFEAALAQGIPVIVNGGDMFPKDFAETGEQEMFVGEFLAPHIDCLKAHGIEYYGMFGNDDIMAIEESWRQLLSDYDNAHDLTDKWHSVGSGLIIRGCSYVPDHPFGLKDWSVLDTRDFVRPPQLGQAVLSDGKDYVPIADIDEFFEGRSTLADILSEIAKEAPSPLERAIFVSHTPPAGTGLGNVEENVDVGSVAVRRWIEKHQPLLTLHGHIHESPEITGRQTAQIGRTIAHQPGQRRGGAVTISLVTIEEDRVGIATSRVPT